MTDDEMRKGLAMINGGFASVEKVLDKKGLKANRADIQKAAIKGGSEAGSGVKDPKVEEQMKNDPRLMLLNITCGNESVSLSFMTANKSKYANLPFKPGHYRIVPRGQDKPGDFTILAQVKDGATLQSYDVSEPGTLDLTQFDAHALKGKFLFSAKGPDAHRVKANGTFSIPCKGSAICKP